MTRKPPKTLEQMAAEASGQTRTVYGSPATLCPHCGAGMFVDGVNRTEREIVRYVQCRNGRCGRRFLTTQPPAKIIREIAADEDDSAGGKPSLTLLRESA